MDYFAWPAWYNEDTLQVQVIVTIKASGSGYLELQPFESDWTLYAKDGSVAMTGGFSYAYPKYLAAGETGYLIEDATDDQVKKSDLGKLEADGRYIEVDVPGSKLVVSSTKLRRDRSSGSVTVSGVVRNQGPKDVGSASAAAIYFGEGGKLLGASTTNLIENLDVGQQKGFETVTDSPPLKTSDIKEYDVVASSTDF